MRKEHEQPGKTQEPAGQIESRPGPLAPPSLSWHFREYRGTDHDNLVEMFLNFEPKGAFQGLPPRSGPVIRMWLDGLLKNKAMFFVIEFQNRIVGHAMLCSSLKNTAEVAIFLHQKYRGLGLGKKLLLGVLNYACRRLQLSRVWLSVQGANGPALSLFREVGFRHLDEAEPMRWEYEMARPLSCKPCLEDRCAIFGQGFPFVHEITKNSGTRASSM